MLCCPLSELIREIRHHVIMRDIRFGRELLDIARRNTEVEGSASLGAFGVRGAFTRNSADLYPPPAADPSAA